MSEDKGVKGEEITLDGNPNFEETEVATEQEPFKEKSEEGEPEPVEPIKTSKVFIWSVVFIILLIALFFSVRFFYHPQEKIPTYETPTGFSFYYLAGLWNTEFQRGDKLYNLHFHFSPEDVREVPIVGAFDEEGFNKGYVYVTFDPLGKDLTYVNLAAKELVINLVRAINTNVTMACTTNQSSACIGEPIVTCENTDEPVIFIKEGEESLIELKKNCIILQGQEMNLLKSIDKLLFLWFGML